jgi:hypothetical protein
VIKVPKRCILRDTTPNLDTPPLQLLVENYGKRVPCEREEILDRLEKRTRKGHNSRGRSASEKKEWTCGNNEREYNRMRHSRTQKGEEKNNWIVNASGKKTRHSRAASRKIGGCGNKIEHNQTLCDDKVTQTDLFCLPRSENFGISEETHSNWLTKLLNCFFSPGPRSVK